MRNGPDESPAGERRDPGVAPGSAGAQRRPVTLIPGEGAGADAVSAARRVVDAAGARIDWEIVEAGEPVRARGIASGLPWEAVDSVQRTGVVLRGPLTLPGGGLGPTDRLLHQAFDVASQALPIRSLPGAWAGPGQRRLDFWLVRSSLRELEPEVGLDLPGEPWPVTVPAGPADDRLFRRAFELARQEGRRSVRCAVRTDRVNPVGAIRAGMLLLEHVRQREAARRIERGLAATLGQGIGTDDMPGVQWAVSSGEFVDAVIANLHSDWSTPPPPPGGKSPERGRRWRVPPRPTRPPPGPGGPAPPSDPGALPRAQRTRKRRSP